jgi:hypothetical protein
MGDPVSRKFILLFRLPQPAHYQYSQQHCRYKNKSNSKIAKWGYPVGGRSARGHFSCLGN